MESQAALIRTNGAVELYAIAYVYMHFALVVCPRHTERNDTLGLYKALDGLPTLPPAAAEAPATEEEAGPDV